MCLANSDDEYDDGGDDDSDDDDDDDDSQSADVIDWNLCFFYLLSPSRGPGIGSLLFFLVLITNIVRGCEHCPLKWPFVTG